MQAEKKTDIWLKLAGLALLLAAAAFGASVIFEGQLGAMAFYAFAPLVFLLIIFFAAVMVRIRVFGRLPSDADRLRSEVNSRLPTAILKLARFWAIFKIGILGAVILLLVGSVISGIAGTGIQRGVEGFVYLTLLMMFGNLVVGTVVNLNLVKQARSRTN